MFTYDEIVDMFDMHAFTDKTRMLAAEAFELVKQMDIADFLKSHK